MAARKQRGKFVHATSDPAARPSGSWQGLFREMQAPLIAKLTVDGGVECRSHWC